MENNKRIGLFVMTAAFLVGVTSLIMSSGGQAGVDYFFLVTTFFQLQMFEQGNGYLIDVPTKYVILACLFCFAVGFLFFVGAFGKSKSNISKEMTK